MAGKIIKRIWVIIRISALVKILTGDNMGFDGNNEHTALWLCNMLENVEEYLKDIIYISLEWESTR